jgi:ribosome recycling factor
VETSIVLSPGSYVKIVFSIEHGDLSAEGTVTRIHPGSGIAVQFKEMNRESRQKMYRILEFIQEAGAMYNDRYMMNLSHR